MRTKIDGNGISSFFNDHGLTHIAIYGMGINGKLLFDDLKKSDIKIDFCMDRNKNNIIIDIPIYDLNDNIPDTEAIIITPVIEFDIIKKQLKPKTTAHIFSFEEIVNWG